MRREERRWKFNEAVVNCLYPPPPSPSESDGEEDQLPEISPEEVDVGSFPLPGCSEGSSESKDDDGGEGKLTRAQRKRIRRKRLREESIRRGQMIGPLLPLNHDDESDGAQENETSVARQIAPVKGDSAAGTKQRRVKHRRMAKKQAKGTLNTIVGHHKRSLNLLDPFDEEEKQRTSGRSNLHSALQL